MLYVDNVFIFGTQLKGKFEGLVSTKTRIKNNWKKCTSPTDLL